MAQHCRPGKAWAPLPGHTVASAIRRFHDRFLERHGHAISVEQGLALQSILNCRTKAMGGRRYRCDHCSEDHYAWHSCNHRLCPTCGSSDAADWVAKALAKRLPVRYFMVTFTLPAQLRLLCKYAPRAFYKAFFDCSAQAIRDVLATSGNLGEGSEAGFLGMLQTWTQDLRLHPHIHYIVPGIGIDLEGAASHLPDPEWLAYGSVFASRLRTHLLRRLKAEELMDNAAIQPLWKIEWNCDVENFGDGEHALKYLGRYVFKGPVCDSRIVNITGGEVWISVRSRETGKSDTVRIDGIDFVRRYLQHALPPRFHRLRHYGFLHGRSRRKLARLRDQLESQGLSVAALAVPETPRQPAIHRCPSCKRPMVDTGHRSRAPPGSKTIRKIWRRRFPTAA